MAYCACTSGSPDPGQLLWRRVGIGPGKRVKAGGARKVRFQESLATDAWNGALAAYAPHRRRLWSHHRGARASEGRAQRGVQQLGGAAREKIWNRSQEEVEALRRDPIRSFTFIDLSSKRGVTRPKAKAEGRAAGGDLGARPHSCNAPVGRRNTAAPL